MTKINMFAGNYLLEKLEVKKGEFDIIGVDDKNTPLYKVVHSGNMDNDALNKDGVFVILKPGSYEHVIIDGVDYLYAEEDNLAGKIELNEGDK